ncbi:methyltransferase [Romboutsia lituseburensis]|uniref:methyltransferase n=1 Tax=Romboutsia lituseburensis TaxID=1537 RepID=UPI00215AB652|nr:methyltransferase [Romboutsia lituseburensis]MCR8746648.1 methyltransferase [Romboutsia lituseburensis]
MITKEYIESLEDRGIYLWEEENQLRYKAKKGSMKEDIKQKLSENKGEIIEFLKRNNMYGKCVANKVYSKEIFLENIKKYILENEQNIDKIGLANWIDCANNVSILDIFNTFYANGIFKYGKIYTQEDIIKTLNIDKMYNSLVKKWIETLLEKQIVEKEEDKYFLKDKLIINEISKDYWNDFEDVENRINYGREFFDYLKRCSENLLPVLQKKVNSVELLFPNGATDTAMGIYQNNKISKAFNGIASMSVKEFVKLNSNNKKTIKILEIGAGVGGTTSGVIEELEGMNYEYYFTDISNYFLNMAKEKYKKNENIKYELFDINKSLEGQVLKQDEFDIIICANVLHNAKDGNMAIQSISKLIKDNGIFVIIDEVSEPEFLLTSIDLNEGLSNFEDCRKENNEIFFTYNQWIEMFSKEKVDLLVDFPKENTELKKMGQKIFIGRFKEVNLINKHNESISFEGKLKKTKKDINNDNYCDSKIILQKDKNMEKNIKNIWIDILKVEELDVNDNFFEVGGDSLVITQLISKLWKEYSQTKNWDWSMFADTIMKNPTVSSLSLKIQELYEKDVKFNEKDIELLNLTKSVKKKKIILFHNGTGNINVYKNLIDEINNVNKGSYELYGINFNKEILIGSKNLIKELAINYANKLIEEFSGSNFELIGHCVGGSIALEVANILKNKNENVEKVFIISSYLNKQLIVDNLKENDLDKLFKSNFLMSLVFSQLVNDSLITKSGIDISSKYISDVVGIIRDKNNGEFLDEYIVDIKNEHENFYNLYKVYLNEKEKYSEESEMYCTFLKHFEATSKYIPEKYNGEVVFFKCIENVDNFIMEEEQYFSDDLFLWSKYLKGNIIFSYIGGNHINCIENFDVEKISGLLG